jgi:deazaflavin-dependent oxidoreductase (nitroreductase family)
MTNEILYGDEHVEQYRATDGAQGHDWRNGTSILLLTTNGRRSGEPRTAPLIYAEQDGVYAIVASKGGADEPPAWYLNLLEDPEVRVQVREDVFDARARTASDEEKAHWWPIMVSEWPDYDEYQTKTDRPIPIVLLERT